MCQDNPLIAIQAAKVAELESLLAQLEADGNEYHAAQVREEIVVAKSPARLIHKAIPVR